MLQNRRSNKKVSYLGELDHNEEWWSGYQHFWTSPKISYFKQRLAFAHIHKAEILRDIDEDYWICEECGLEADWLHVFYQCERCEYEKKALYNEWDLNLPFYLRFVQDLNEDTLLHHVGSSHQQDIASLNDSRLGPVAATSSHQQDLASVTKPFLFIIDITGIIVKEDIPREVDLDALVELIYIPFYNYVENCYKNADWNNMPKKRKNYKTKNYVPKPSNYSSAWRQVVQKQQSFNSQPLLSNELLTYC